MLASPRRRSLSSLGVSSDRLLHVFSVEMHPSIRVIRGICARDISRTKVNMAHSLRVANEHSLKSCIYLSDAKNICRKRSKNNNKSSKKP